MSQAAYDAIVIGCGVAGLAALSALSRAGLRVLGLEADERVGGRVHTVQFGEGVVELGAQWIHGETNNRVFELARQHKLPISKDTLDFEFRLSDGSKLPEGLCDELLSLCWSAHEELPSTSEGLGDFVTRHFYDHVKDTPTAQDTDFCSGFLSFVHLLTNNYNATDHWNDVSTVGSGSYEELEGHMHWTFGRMGYRSLFPLLTQDARADVLLNKEAAHVEWSERGCEVRCGDGTLYRAAAVIVTVSLGVLKERHKQLFNPPLPSAKVQAIDSMSIGVVDKVQLLYSEPWWPRTRQFFGFVWRGEDRKGGGAEWTEEVFGFSACSGCPNAITLWTSGENAKKVEALPEEEVLAGCKGLLQRFMGPDVRVPDPVSMLRSAWYGNPYTRGSYSYRGVATDSDVNVWRHLSAPLCDDTGRPRILFAGEACSPRHYSTVHGAIDTGVKAAESLLSSHTVVRKSKI